jgi:hypothetical protein
MNTPILQHEAVECSVWWDGRLARGPRRLASDFSQSEPLGNYESGYGLLRK